VILCIKPQANQLLWNCLSPLEISSAHKMEWEMSS
jgi:hypothetical protein